MSYGHRSRAKSLQANSSFIYMAISTSRFGTNSKNKKTTKKGRIFCRKMIEWFRFVLKTRKICNESGVGYMETLTNGSGKHELH